jgi:DNA helicase-2/ATP-dependent DNA helicase PcrA
MLEDPNKLLEDLTPEQGAAVSHLDGPALVLAGPGSGKTRVITRRIAWLVGNGIPAWQILALTFTNKAAGEMRERVDELIPETVAGRRGLFVSTFHAFCARQLRVHAERLGLDAGFSIYSTTDQRSAMKESIANSGLESGNWTPASMLAAVSDAKNKLQTVEAYDAEASDFYTRTVARAYAGYQKILARNNAVDFDDLLLKTAALLRGHDDVRSELQERFRYVLIDEYQDTNHAQFVIADSIASAHGNLFVVGDPDQSIYGWRGADVGNILDFESQYPGTSIIALGRNFRSTGHIVGAAAGLIANNRRRKHKDLHTDLGDGEQVSLLHCRDERHEAEQLAEKLRAASDEGLDYRDMAVLYRVNALSRVLEDSLRSAGIPYVIARGTAFFERKEIKNVLAYLRALANLSDEVALGRIMNVPARGVGKKTIEQLARFAMQNGLPLFEAVMRVSEVEGLGARAVRSVGTFGSSMQRWRSALENGHAGQLPGFVAQVITESGLEAMNIGGEGDEEQERIANLNELVNAAAEYEPDLEQLLAEESTTDSPEPGEDVEVPITLLEVLRGFLESVALVSDQDVVDESRGAVTLMTLHAAKGLEYEVVAMVGLEEGLLPHARSQEGELELEEERRLCYVGMTRARRRLLMMTAASRAVRGVRSMTVPSSFLSEIPTEHLEKSGSDRFGDSNGGFTIEYDADMVDEPGEFGLASRFPAGTVVRHPQFGLGTVRSISPRGSVSAARVDFHAIGTKTLILEYARLERVVD